MDSFFAYFALRESVELPCASLLPLESYSTVYSIIWYLIWDCCFLVKIILALFDPEMINSCSSQDFCHFVGSKMFFRVDEYFELNCSFWWNDLETFRCFFVHDMCGDSFDDRLFRLPELVYTFTVFCLSLHKFNPQSRHCKYFEDCNEYFNKFWEDN